MTPKIIHLIFLREEEIMPELFNKCMHRIKAMHPSWKVYLYNEQNAQEILSTHLPQYLDAYNSFEHNVQKADFLRAALVYIYGGFYMDLDMLSLKALDELRGHNLVLAEEKTICDTEQRMLNLKHRLRVANYMFGSIPKHSFWLALLDRMAALSRVNIKTQQELLDTTGPGLLTDLFLDNLSLYPDVFFLDNINSKFSNSHFGEYAAHLHAGTWRKEI